MGYLRCLPPAALLASLLVEPLARAEAPQVLPTRDVDVTYDGALRAQPRVRERVRWLAAEKLERVDGPHKSTTIFNRRTHPDDPPHVGNPLLLFLRSWICPRGSRRSPRRRPDSSAAMNQSLRDCTVSTGLGPKTWKRALCASRRMACCFGFSSTARRLRRRVR